MSEIKAIETRYKGYKFRSRLEARWARCFDALGLAWEYEKEGFDLGSEGWYLPDFWFPASQTWVEIKPGPAPDVLSIYLAGKMTNWRDGLNLHGHWKTGPDEATKAHEFGVHRTGLLSEAEVIRSCSEGIQKADVIACWINSLDCYGTLAEIGMASALKKRIVIGFDHRTHLKLCNKADREYWDDYRGGETPHHAMWFIDALGDVTYFCDRPQELIDEFVPKLNEEERKCAALSRQNRVVLVYGQPFEDEYQTLTFSGGSCELRANGHPARWMTWNETARKPQSAIVAAYQAARAARFEHGECG